MAVASLVLGILALLVGVVLTMMSSLSVGFTVGIPLALLALGVGVIARRGAVRGGHPTGVANTGIVLGVVATLIGAAAVALFLFAIQSARSSDDPATAARLQQERIKNSAEFDDVFKKAVEADQTAPAKKPDATPHKTPPAPTH